MKCGNHQDLLVKVLTVVKDRSAHTLQVTLSVEEATMTQINLINSFITKLMQQKLIQTTATTLTVKPS